MPRPKGFKLSEESKQKLREANLGKKLSEEAKLKLSIFNKGKSLSEEHKRKISESIIRNGKLKGRIYTKEQNMNRSLKLRGKNSPMYGKKGKEHPCWKGGTYIDGDGYRRIYMNGKSYHEHHLVFTQYTGMPVWNGCIIHHINGNKLDNKPENLALLPRDYHSQQHSILQYKDN